MGKIMLSPHHEAWLNSHPTRTVGWLSQMIAEGFDVHHLDGDHGNNDPLNLVLIESEDHQLVIHGHKHLRRLIKVGAPSMKARCSNIAPIAYDEYAKGGMSWKEIADQFGIEKWQALTGAVADYAKNAGRKWPVFDEHPSQRVGHPANERLINIRIENMERLLSGNDPFSVAA